jgi:hypothetical protein
LMKAANRDLFAVECYRKEKERDESPHGGDHSIAAWSLGDRLLGTAHSQRAGHYR